MATKRSTEEERIRDEQEVRVDVQPVANETREEPMERGGRRAAEERHEPLRDHGEERDDRPQEQPDEVRNRQREPEQDGEARYVGTGASDCAVGD